jgi:hypothetical protein
LVARRISWEEGRRVSERRAERVDGPVPEELT